MRIWYSEPDPLERDQQLSRINPKSLLCRPESHREPWRGEWELRRRDGRMQNTRLSFHQSFSKPRPAPCFGSSWKGHLTSADFYPSLLRLKCDKVSICTSGSAPRCCQMCTEGPLNFGDSRKVAADFSCVVGRASLYLPFVSWLRLGLSIC